MGGGWSGGKTETSEGEGVRMGMGRVGGSAVVVVVGERVAVTGRAGR